MCTTVIVQYTCGCLGRTLGKDKCPYLVHNENLLEDLEGAGLRLWARAMEINRGCCAKMREGKEWRPYCCRWKCGGCVRAGRERTERGLRARELGKMGMRREGGNWNVKTIEEERESEVKTEDDLVQSGTVVPDIVKGVGIHFEGLNIVNSGTVKEGKGSLVIEGPGDTERKSGENMEIDNTWENKSER